MRRPRGPGGRFLTAEEIAAQKLAQQPTPEENTPAILVDSPDPPSNQDQVLALDSQNHIHPVQDANLSATSFNPLSHSNPSPPALSPPLAPSFPDNNRPSPSAPAQSPPLQSSSPILPGQSHHATKATTNASVSLRPPYSQAQMHHVPHPHAHTRLRHSHLNFTDGLYQGDESPQGASGADNPMMAFSSQTGS